MNRRLAILGAFVLIVGGFILVKAPTPAISIAAEPILDLGGYEVTNTILSFWVVMILLIGLTLLLYRRLRNVEAALVPTGFQNVIEALLEAFFDIVKLVAGEKNGRRFFPIIASIFVILLFANWFGLFPWNNAIGKTIDVRFEHLELLEEDAEDLVAELDQVVAAGKISVAQLNRTFGEFYLDPISFQLEAQDEADAQIERIVAGGLSDRERAVREAFVADPLPAGSEGVLEGLEERLEGALEEYPFSAQELALLEIDDQEHAQELALVFNLPLPSSAVSEAELKGAVIKAGGVNLIPIKASDFEYNPYVEGVVVTLNAEGGFASARLFDNAKTVGEDNPAVSGSELRLPVITMNTTHVGVFLKMEAEGLSDGEGVAEIFPFFRSVATDLNLPLAIALWSFIFVQLWGIQALGVGSNFGKYIGVGKAAVVKGPIGVMVGFLEVISEISRIVSFTFRLFGNIFAGEIVLFMSAFLVPFVISSVFYGLEVFVGFIQAFVFAMLTLVFAVTAISHGGQDEEFEGEAADH